MNSNLCINEILADARVKSANADEIFSFASDEIKSTHSPSRRISPNEVGFHRSRRFHSPARVDLVEKSTDKVDAFFWCGRQDLNLHIGRYQILNLARLPIPPRPHSIFNFVPLIGIRAAKLLPALFKWCGAEDSSTRLLQHQKIHRAEALDIFCVAATAGLRPSSAKGQRPQSQLPIPPTVYRSHQPNRRFGVSLKPTFSIPCRHKRARILF